MDTKLTPVVVAKLLPFVEIILAAASTIYRFVRVCVEKNAMRRACVSVPVCLEGLK